MKKKFVYSTMILLSISVIAKILSFFVRILLARNLSNDAMNLYTLSSPTMVMLITLAQMGIPNALSKIIAQSKNHHSFIKACIIMSVFNNILLILCFLTSVSYLSNNILKQPLTLSVLYMLIPLIPLVSISGILKGYLFGSQKPIPATLCQIYEELSRIIFLLIIFFIKKPLTSISLAQLAILSVSVGEACSIMYMLIYIYKNKHSNITVTFTSIPSFIFSELLSVSIPMTGSKLIGSITYFLEPIVMVYGLNSSQINIVTSTYTSLHAFVLPLITMPSFLTIALSNFLLPSFTYHYTRDHKKQASKQFTFIILCCLFIGLSCSSICFFFPNQLMMMFYHSEKAAFLLKQLAIPFIIYSLQPPLSSMLHAMSCSKYVVYDTLIGSIIRIMCILLFASYTPWNVLLISVSIGMITTTSLYMYHLYHAFKKNLK